MEKNSQPHDLESTPLLEFDQSKSTFTDQVSSVAAPRLGVDLRAVVAFQSVLALMVLFFVVEFAFDKADWFNSGASSLVDPHDDGFMVPKDSSWIKHIFFGRSNAHATYAQLALSAILAVCVLGRLQPRLCLLLLLFLMISLHGKSRYVQDCGGRLLRHMLFWACLLPNSVAPHNRWSGSKIISGVAAFGVQFQLLYVYWQVISHRTNATEWVGPDFSAVYYALSGDYGLPAGLFLAQTFPGICRLLTIGSMIIEALGPFIPLFIPLHSWWRALPALALMSMHAGIAMTMNLRHFSLLAMGISVIYLPTPFWDAVGSFNAKADTEADCLRPNRKMCGLCAMPLLRETVGVMALAYVVLHMEVFESKYRDTPLDDHAILYTSTTLDELWIMYSGANTQGTYWDIHADSPQHHGKVDVLQWARTGTWKASSTGKADDLPSCFSCLYPNMRWEIFLSKTAKAPEHVRKLRMQAMTRWLCARGLGPGSKVHFANRQFLVNPPGSQEHFRGGGTRVDETFACEAD